MMCCFYLLSTHLLDRAMPIEFADTAHSQKKTGRTILLHNIFEELNVVNYDIT